MLYMLRYFLQRIRREGFKSVTVPILALVLVVLISIMDGIRIQQADKLEYVIDNFEIRVIVTDADTRSEFDLQINNRFVRLFTDEQAQGSVSKYVKDVELKRAVDYFLTLDPNLRWYQQRVSGSIVGITSIKAEPLLDPLIGTYIEYFDGYDESIFRSDERVCVVPEAIYDSIDSSSNIWSVELRAEIPDEIVEVPVFVKAELLVIGVVHGVEDTAYSPFWTVSEYGRTSDGVPAHTVIMNALMADNRKVEAFKKAAAGNFVSPGEYVERRPFAIEVLDGTYNEILSNLKQNIMLLDALTPFIHIITICIGFLTSFLLTRRRMPEFAMMRSLGIKKRDIFAGVIIEQAVLCAAGSLIGSLLYQGIWGSVGIAPALIFFACYISGTVCSAIRAAGANVLRILRMNE